MKPYKVIIMIGLLLVLTDCKEYDNCDECITTDYLLTGGDSIPVTRDTTVHCNESIYKHNRERTQTTNYEIDGENYLYELKCKTLEE